nr:hypothetical protein [Bacteroidales bacterium]
PTLDERPFKAFAGSSLSVEAKLRKKNENGFGIEDSIFSPDIYESKLIKYSIKFAVEPNKTLKLPSVFLLDPKKAVAIL